MTGAPFIASEVAEMIYRGQLYEQLRIEPFERKDGSASSIAIWRSTCPQCQSHFECTTPAIAPRFRPARRCHECRQECRWSHRPKSAETAKPAPLRSGQRPFAPVEVYQDDSK